MVSLHVLVDPLPVAATELLSSKKTGLVVPSSTETLAEQVKLLTLADLTVMVIVTVIVPVNVVAAGSSSSSPAVAGTGRNAPVWGSRNPRMPRLGGVFAGSRCKSTTTGSLFSFRLLQELMADVTRVVPLS